MTSGILAQSILRVLALDSRSLARLQEALPQHPSPQVATAVEKLRQRGLVVAKMRVLMLTRAGRAAAPSNAPDLSKLHGTYAPPRVERRSRAEHVPSRYGDTYVYGRRI